MTFTLNPELQTKAIIELQAGFNKVSVDDTLTINGEIVNQEWLDNHPEFSLNDYGALGVQITEFQNGAVVNSYGIQYEELGLGGGHGDIFQTQVDSSKPVIEFHNDPFAVQAAIDEVEAAGAQEFLDGLNAPIEFEFHTIEPTQQTDVVSDEFVLSQVNNIVGTNNDDKLNGTVDKDVIVGKFGSDKIYGRDGDDVVEGNRGSDVIRGNKGDDILRGGKGKDTLIGGKNNDRLYGGSGNDWIKGGSGKDKLYGGSGKDTLFGGSGNDLIIGGKGRDKAFGGSGKDVFSLEKGKGHMKIEDFDFKKDSVEFLGAVTFRDRGDNLNMYSHGDLIAVISGGAGRQEQVAFSSIVF